ncbi:hypothetical protein IF188_04175 [Microbacterium sp. NEAU-LLC]|uniref:UDP-N-acetylmuramoylalanyl-D-glutamate--2, 6-diaminopimelate ligase n=1 Tax=Microbacterium helvum TaxID=2773713 RepID=A0ABR8NJR7_9MICO|nr:DUF6510 family protein [Microbacterium helvum]MBD3940899.1 hypothetical protein [Microbacterium helvum]
MRAENATSTVDGNAVAGMLWDVFGADVTAVVGVCGGCGSAAPFAEAVVELDEAAAIVRCRSCTHTLFTVLSDESRTRLILGTLHEIVRE